MASTLSAILFICIGVALTRAMDYFAKEARHKSIERKKNELYKG